MFYCLHSFQDPLGIESYMITRPLGVESTILIVCGKVTGLQTEYYFSHKNELPMMGRKLRIKPDLTQHGASKVTYLDYIKALYC